jgi:hypothetical protein
MHAQAGMRQFILNFFAGRVAGCHSPLAEIWTYPAEELAEKN